jgi:diguanylate cyclase (GGDEF)-like protein/putative nucleotidyltransferase with HDIG domain
VPGERSLRQRLGALIRHTRRLWATPDLSRRQPLLAARVGGGLYLGAGIYTLLLLAIPGTTVTQPAMVLVLGLAGVAYGALRVGVVRRVPHWVLSAGTLAGPGMIALAVHASGGFDSPARMLPIFVVVYAALFMPGWFVALAVASAVGFHEAPLIYDDHALSASPMADAMSTVLAFGALAIAVMAGRTLLTRVSDEHSAMRELATAVAAGASLLDVSVLASQRIAALVGADACGILDLHRPGMARVSGSWSNGVATAVPAGTELPLIPGEDLQRALEEQRAVRTDRHDAGKRAARLGYGCSLTSPIVVRGRVRGAIAVASVAPESLPAESERLLAEFAEIIGIAIANAEAHAQLVAQAASDPLTGLANHRVFHERLREELSRALRHGRPLALALLDVDRFKTINDSLGHERGDTVLAAVAATLARCARAEDVLARLGGDEFALLMPETTEHDALTVVERVRDAIGATELGAPATAVTVSAGVCGVEHAQEADALVRLADGALYWSKAHGRDAACVYDPAVVRELSITERAEQLQRSQALLGIRALARAIDAKDQSTREHSQRVAWLACAIARGLRWSDERVALLEEAALVHDVGKIGIPDAVLLKPGRLTDEEFEQIKRHAELGAQMVEDVLSPEQVRWIRAHHERPDGAGYPDGLAGAQIPDGAAILAVADAFDVMTATRVYSAARSREEALAECERLVGAQFAPEPVAALVELCAADALTPSGR